MNSKKLTILKGEGSNVHSIYGNITHQEVTDYMELEVENATLKHEKPNGQFSGEHKELKLPNGKLLMGKQVEWSPFSQEVTRILD